jgi:hypothetical protein
MFVPSLSWQNDRFLYINGSKMPFFAASLSGAARYGRSVFSVYSAAKRLLAAVDETAATDPVAALPPPVQPAPPPLTLHAQATAALAGRELAPGVDPDMAWLTGKKQMPFFTPCSC